MEQSSPNLELTRSILAYCAHQQREAALENVYKDLNTQLLALQQRVAQNDHDRTEQAVVTRLALERMVQLGGDVLLSTSPPLQLRLAIKSESVTASFADSESSDSSDKSDEEDLIESSSEDEVSREASPSPPSIASSPHIVPLANSTTALDSIPIVTPPCAPSPVRLTSPAIVQPFTSTTIGKRRVREITDSIEEGEVTETPKRSKRSRIHITERPPPFWKICDYFNSRHGCYYSASRCRREHCCESCYSYSHGAYDGHARQWE